MLILFLKAITALCTLSPEDIIKIASGKGVDLTINGATHVALLDSNGILQPTLRLHANWSTWGCELIESYEATVAKLVDLGVLQFDGHGEIEQSDTYDQELESRVALYYSLKSANKSTSSSTLEQFSLELVRRPTN